MHHLSFGPWVEFRVWAGLRNRLRAEASRRVPQTTTPPTAIGAYLKVFAVIGEVCGSINSTVITSTHTTAIVPTRADQEPRCHGPRSNRSPCRSRSACDTPKFVRCGR